MSCIEPRGQAMRRRDFITLVSGAAAAWPMVGRARQAGAHLGYLAFRSPISADDAFLERLRELGWIEGQNLIVERRFAVGSVDRLKEFASELARNKVDVIVASASAATQAAKDATTSIPIIFANAGDPVGQKFVQSLARPGGNITGVAFDASPDITAKQAQLLIESVPSMSRLAVLWNPTSVFLHSYLDVLTTSASALHVTLQSLEVRDPKEFEAAFEAMTRERADGVIVLSDTFTTFHRARLAELAAKYKLPAMYGHDQYTEAGGLMSYGPLFSDGYRHAANFVDKILKGAKPADLPVEQPTKFELIINLKTAKALGLKIPTTVLARADKLTN
jgi:putative tryptophan/tyrosine transport system substrate-binding protein